MELLRAPKVRDRAANFENDREEPAASVRHALPCLVRIRLSGRFSRNRRGVLLLQRLLEACLRFLPWRTLNAKINSLDLSSRCGMFVMMSHCYQSYANYNAIRLMPPSIQGDAILGMCLSFH